MYKYIYQQIDKEKGTIKEIQICQKNKQTEELKLDIMLKNEQK